MALSNGLILILVLNCLALKYETPEDCNWKFEKFLFCGEHTNFSSIPSEHTTFLVVNCNTSFVPSLSFAHLNKLRSLTLFKCKIPSWPAMLGLSELRNLTINTYNAQFEIQPRSFDNLKQLEYLDLTWNNLLSFPEYVLCPLKSLIHLNISSNNLQDISDLKFTTIRVHVDENVTDDAEILNELQSTACSLLDIQILDASHNSFGHIPGNTLSSLRRLSLLKVNNNGLISISDRALAGLKNLRVFDISNNKIVALPPGLFIECGELRELYLQNNSLVALAPDLFAGLTHLLSLDLSRNKLTSAFLNANTFSGLIRLVLLNLSENRLSKLQQDFFSDLYTLQILNLGRNLLEILPANAFTPMKNLHTLVLSYNKLKVLESSSFSGLFALSLLALDNNVLEILHPDSLKNCSAALQDLTLNGNNLKELPAAAMAHLTLLKNLDLGENSLEQLEQPSFKGMDSLQGLRLVRNNLKIISTHSFTALPSLQILNIANNKIKKIENESFAGNLNLQAIRLDSNEISDIEGLFSHLRSLEWLNVSANQIKNFDYSYIPSSLQWLDIHDNKIRQIQDSQNKIGGMNLRSIDASFNKIEKIGKNTFPNTSRLIVINDNLISNVEPLTFDNKPNLTRVDLYSNKIERMESSALQLSQNVHQAEFYIGGNPFKCDCTMEWLQRMQNKSRVLDLDSVYCQLAYTRNKGNFVALLEALPAHLVCPYESHCFALCHCCDYDACDCEMTCPNNCSCYHDESWSAANLVDCSLSNHNQLPTKIPMDATEVYLDGNRFGQLTSHLFIGRKNLRVLFLNASKVDEIHNHTFTGLKRLKILYLQHNNLQELHGFEFHPLEDLIELYLHRNKLITISNYTFSELNQLQVLRLDGNMLHTYPAWQLNFPQKISLADNNWSCQCQFLREFRIWLKTNMARVIDAGSVACVLRVQQAVDGSVAKKLGPYLTDFNSTACSSLLIANGYLDSEFDEESFISLSNIIIIISVTGSILCALCLALRQRGRPSLWLHCGLKKCFKAASVSNIDEERTNNKYFDAYVTYNVHDGGFVIQALVPALEPPLRLCLQHRDFSSSQSLYDVLESSRKVILILSAHFLATEWPELRSSLISRRSLIVIKLEEVGEPIELKKATKLTWGDKKFWQKLRKLLPESGDARHNNCIPRSLQQSGIWE